MMTRGVAALLLVAASVFVTLDARPMQSTSSGAAPAAPAFSEPGISPDGREIAFVSGGDIWSVPAAGGEARLLVANDAYESRPLFSPDGRSLAFMSTRTGGGDIYVLTLETGNVRRVTFDDGPEQLDAWSADGRWIYFSTSGHDIASMNDVYRVSADDGTPMPVTEDRYVNEFGAAPSPDGARLAFVARGAASSQWWRNGSSHLDQSEIWLMNLSGAPRYTQVVPLDAKHEWPMWAPDGSLWYVSDRGGAENLEGITLESKTRRQLTTFRDGRVLWPSMTRDGRTIAFERNFGIWTVRTTGGGAHEVPIARRGAPASPTPERVRQTSQFQDLALSPDGKKIVFVARGDVFAASAKDGGDAMRVTSTPAIESDPVWSPDSRSVAYVSTRDGASHVFLYDFTTSRERAHTSGPGLDRSPVFSPDGKEIAYVRDAHELHAASIAGGDDRLLARDEFGDGLGSPRPAWSPDGRWVAMLTTGAKAFTNVALIPAAGGTPRPVSFLADASANVVAWSHDGTYLIFDTRQRTEPGQLARVDLILRAPKYREDQFRDLFQPPPAPRTQNPEPSTGIPEPRAANPEPVFADIRRRLTLLPVGIDVESASISPDGKLALITASVAGQTNLYTYSLDELATERPVARQLTSTSGGKSDAQFTPDGKEVFYLEGGRVAAISLDKRETRTIPVTAEMTEDFGVEKAALFTQAWTLMRDNFFDAAFNGVDWNAERAEFAPRVAAAATPDELRRLLRLMIGDLNASHLGVTAPGGAAPAVGRLGLTFDRQTYEASGALKITSVVPLAPAALAGTIAPGQYLVAVNGRALGPRVNLDDVLTGEIDRRVVLAVADAPGAPARDVVVKPVSQTAEKALLYRDWVETNRAYVLEASGGRLGYVHMINMAQTALDQLFVDLDVENHQRDGVVVDIRNNSGGFVNAYALDVFARQPYLRMTLRGMPEAPARGVLGQRALELPTVLVTNQHSLSDAEDFTEGYRALKLGQVVGEPTAGWIIYTWETRLFDGTTFRLPRMRVKAADGSDMERHPRPVDVEVTRPIGESLTGRDSQLDAAIRTLLKQLGKAQ